MFLAHIKFGRSPLSRPSLLITAIKPRPDLSYLFRYKIEVERGPLLWRHMLP